MITTVFLLAISILFVTFGHICKMYRWSLSIDIYEKPDLANLLKAISVGQTINTLLPLRLGDIAKILIAGKNLKNSYTFALVTTIVDFFFDIVVIGIILNILAAIIPSSDLYNLAHQYLFILGILTITIIFCISTRKKVKKVISQIAAIFNRRLEFIILYATYLTIVSFKDVAKRINRTKLVSSTITMWCSYLVAYHVFALALQTQGENYNLIQILIKLFSFAQYFNLFKQFNLIWLLFLVAPLLLCWLGAHYIDPTTNKNRVSRPILPQIRESERLAFLQTYYRDENREQIQIFLDINQDVSIIADCSSGSNASTLIVMKENGKMFFRKYAFNQDSQKLTQQINWIKNHQSNLALPAITSVDNRDHFTAYDMPSYNGTSSLLRYAHTMPITRTWTTITTILTDLDQKLYTPNLTPANRSSLRKYLHTKVDNNLNFIKESKLIKTMERYDFLVVNGQKLPNLNHYHHLLTPEHLASIFAHDNYSDIHGDLTFENIICLTADSIDTSDYRGVVIPNSYYLIDPNTGNVHESPFLDYAKLLQSLHGNYEFLATIDKIDTNGNIINYLETRSTIYENLYQRYHHYLNTKFSSEEVLSIYHHEVIHWLRLLPYKIKKDSQQAIVYYISLLKVLQDVERLQNEK